MRDGRSGWLGVAPAREALATAAAAAGSATEGLVPAAAATGRVARRVARRQRRPYTPSLRRPEGVAPGRAGTRACRPHRALPLPASQSHCAVGAAAGAASEEGLMRLGWWAWWGSRHGPAPRRWLG